MIMKLHLFLTVVLMSSAAKLEPHHKGNSPTSVVPNEPYNDKRIVCIYPPYWVYHSDDFDPFLCTHLIYIPNRSYDAWLDFKSQDLIRNAERGPNKRLVKLSEKNPQLKVLLFANRDFYLSSRGNGSNLGTVSLKAAVTFLKTYGYHGLDFYFDWDSSCDFGLSNIKMAQALKATFKLEGLMLTADVFAKKEIIEDCYDVPEMVKLFDFINVVTFNYYERAGMRFDTSLAPLYARPEATEWESTSNVNFSINYWIDKGCPPSKLNLGISTYGSFLKPFPYERVSYWKICQNLKEGNWTKVIDPYYKTPYAYRGDEGMLYDDEASVTEKVKFANQLVLGGVWINDLKGDDSRAHCGSETFPILKAVKKAIRELTVNSTSTQLPYESQSQNSGQRSHFLQHFFELQILQKIFYWWLSGM